MFEGALQVEAGNGLSLVRPRVLPEGAPERLVSQFLPQAIHEQRTLGILDGTPERQRRVTLAAGELAIDAGLFCGFHPLPRELHLAVVGIPAPTMFFPRRHHENGDALVEPELRQIAAGEGVAP